MYNETFMTKGNYDFRFNLDTQLVPISQEEDDKKNIEY